MNNFKWMSHESISDCGFLVRRIKKPSYAILNTSTKSLNTEQLDIQGHCAREALVHSVLWQPFQMISTESYLRNAASAIPKGCSTPNTCYTNAMLSSPAQNWSVQFQVFLITNTKWITTWKKNKQKERRSSKQSKTQLVPSNDCWVKADKEKAHLYVYKTNWRKNNFTISQFKTRQ